MESIGGAAYMIYKYMYETPDGFDDLIMNGDGEYLTALRFSGSRGASNNIENSEEKELPVFKETCKWLDIYFGGKNPDFIPKYKIENLTPFMDEVVNITNSIPFGFTLAYNDIAKIIAEKRGLEKMSAQAVGGAVGRNPICVIVPCHRVVGSNGSLTGYGGGMKNKIALLAHENNDMSKFFVPKKRTVP